MTKPKISVVIPACNESSSLGAIINQSKIFGDEIIVVDDGSTDETAKIARENGASVVVHNINLGVTQAIKSGLNMARGDVVVTLDADGQHDPFYIPELVAPIIEGKADITLGVREKVPVFSERIINLLTNVKVKSADSGTGFRAIKGDLAKRMNLHGSCLCGTFVLEACTHRARIVEVPIQVRPRINGRRRIRTRHVRQFFYVLYDLLRLGFVSEKREALKTT